MFDFVGPTNRKCKQREIITYIRIHRVSSALEREKNPYFYMPQFQGAPIQRVGSAEKVVFYFNILTLIDSYTDGYMMKVKSFSYTFCSEIVGSAD